MRVQRIALLAGLAAAAALAFAPGASVAAGSRTFELTVPATATARDGWRTAALPAARGFDLLGARWRGPRADGEVELRVRRANGGWSRWAHAHAGAPIWSGRAEAVQLRGARPVRGLRVRLVAVDGARSAGAEAATAARRAARAAADGRPPIVPRAAWDPRGECRPRTPPRYGRVDFAVVHHTQSLAFYGPGQSAAMVLAICRFHRDGNRWLDVGYNLLVDRYGTVFEGRAGGVDQPVVGAQAGGWNTVSTGVAVIGSFTGAPPPAAAQRALARVLAWKLSLAGVPAQGTVLERSFGGDENRWRAGATVRLRRIVGHRDVDLTDCPGNAFYALLPGLRREVATLQPAAGSLLTISPHGVPLEQAEPLWLTGRLVRAGGRRPRGAEVRVEQRVGGTWAELATTRTGRDGVWSAYPRLTVSGPLRAVAPASGAVSAEVPIQVRAGVRLRATPRVLRAGGSLRVRGATTPPKPAVRVVVERRLRSGGWRRVTTRHATMTGGRFEATLRLRRPGTYRLTAATRADAGNAAGFSPARVVRVLRRR